MDSAAAGGGLTAIRLPYRHLRDAEMELVSLNGTRASAGEGPPKQPDQDHVERRPSSTRKLVLACMVAAGVQFGWALQLSLLTPYIQVYLSHTIRCGRWISSRCFPFPSRRGAFGVVIPLLPCWAWLVASEHLGASAHVFVFFPFLSWVTPPHMEIPILHLYLFVPDEAASTCTSVVGHC